VSRRIKGKHCGDHWTDNFSKSLSGKTWVRILQLFLMILWLHASSSPLIKIVIMSLIIFRLSSQLHSAKWQRLHPKIHQNPSCFCSNPLQFKIFAGNKLSSMIIKLRINWHLLHSHLMQAMIFSQLVPRRKIIWFKLSKKFSKNFLKNQTI